jgi:hypothetical protein
MEPEPEKIELSVLDPGGWERKAVAIAAQAARRSRLRRRVVRRGAIAVVLAAAAAIAVWLGAPEREPTPRTRSDLLDWAVRDVQPSEVLGIGDNDAR